MGKKMKVVKKKIKAIEKMAKKAEKSMTGTITIGKYTLTKR